MQQSVYDRVGDALSPALRNLSDMNAKILGTQVTLLRITKETDDFTQKPYNVFGDYETTWQSTLLSNVIIQYPFNQREIYAQVEGEKFVGKGIDLMDALPITIDLQFSGEYLKDPIVMKVGDILVDVAFDENQNPMPFRMELKRMVGSFFAKNLVSKKAEVSLTRGQEMNPVVEAEISKFIAKVQKDREFYAARIKYRC